MLAHQKTLYLRNAVDLLLKHISSHVCIYIGFVYFSYLFLFSLFYWMRNNLDPRDIDIKKNTFLEDSSKMIEKWWFSETVIQQDRRRFFNRTFQWQFFRNFSIRFPNLSSSLRLWTFWVLCCFLLSNWWWSFSWGGWCRRLWRRRLLLLPMPPVDLARGVWVLPPARMPAFAARVALLSAASARRAPQRPFRVHPP